MIPDNTLKIMTLGRFSMFFDGKLVEADWPDETIKLFFCSLLSPMDLYVTWDRMCRSLWDEPVTRVSRHRLEQSCIRPLNILLIKHLGFSPLITGEDGIRIDKQRIYLDALEFYSFVLEGLRLLCLDNHAAALKKISRANALYAGDYLPGLPGKIIINTRTELESLYRTNCDHGRHAAHTAIQLLGL